MKTLLIARHAKSSWKFENIKDIDRSLKESGIQNAYEISSKLDELKIIPDQIITSPAIRAFHTARIFAEILGVEGTNIKIENNLYETTTNSIFKLLKKISNTKNCIAIFGHNPTFTELAFNLVPDFHFDMPTCSVAVINFEIDSWSKIEPTEGILKEFIFPEKQ